MNNKVNRAIHSETAKKFGITRETAKRLNYLYGADEQTLRNILGQQEGSNKKMVKEIGEFYTPRVGIVRNE